MVYETLTLLERANNIPFTKDVDYSHTSHYINEFQKLTENHYKKERYVEYYAGRLYITSNYLNKIVHQSLRISTKQYLSNLLYNAAERLLKHTTLTINDIVLELGLDIASFIKKFKQRKSTTPLQYRNEN